MNTDPLLYLRDKDKVQLADYLQWLVSRDFFGGSRLAIDNFVAKSVEQNRLSVYDSKGQKIANCSPEALRSLTSEQVALNSSNYVQEESVIGIFCSGRTLLQ